MNSPTQRGARMSLRAAVAAALFGVASLPAHADDDLRLSGFGTLGYAMDDRHNIAPARDISQKPENSFNTGSGVRLDTRFGAQLEYRLGPSVDLVGQFVVRDHYRARLDNSVELAYAALRPLADLDVRVGRINYDAFLMSDYRNVGYAYTWVRPPGEFYGWIPIFSVDGADAAYNLQTEDANWRVKAQAGSSRFSIPIGEGYGFKADNLLSLSLARRTAHWRFKAAYSRFTIADEVPAFGSLHAGLDGIAATNGEAADLRRNLSFKDAWITYKTLGAAYDDGTWVAQGELGKTTSSAAVVPHGVMAYASVGRRFGAWTPYVMLSASRPGNAVRTAATSWGGLNTALRDPALYNVNTTRIEQDTVSVGTRWDFHARAAFKLQWESTTIRPSGYGLWWRESALNNQTNRVRMLSATVDFAF